MRLSKSILVMLIGCAVTYGNYSNAEGAMSEERGHEPWPKEKAVERGLTPPKADVRKLLIADPQSVLRVRQGEYEREVAFDTDLPHEEFVGEAEVSPLNLKERIPQNIYIQKDNPTSLEFLDITGAPWPIDTAKAFTDAISLHEVDNESQNSVVLTSEAHAGSRHITVNLQGIPEAIILRVVSGSERYHTRRIFKVDRVASGTDIKFANMESSRTVGMGADEDLMAAINGVRPAGFHSIKTSHPEVQAWSDQEILILKTRLHLLTHVALASEAGDFGVTAIKLNPTSRATFLTDTGEVIDVRIGDL